MRNYILKDLGWLNVLEELDCTNSAVIGDWDANLGTTDTMTFKGTLTYFWHDNVLLMSSQLLLPESTYTDMHSYQGNLYYSWLYHVVSSHNFHTSITNISIQYDMCDDDHIPLSFDVQLWLLLTFSVDVNSISAKTKT